MGVNSGVTTVHLIEIWWASICSKPGDYDVFSRRSPDILDQFSQSFHHMKALWVQMIDLDIVFPFVQGLPDGNQIMLGEVMNGD